MRKSVSQLLRRSFALLLSCVMLCALCSCSAGDTNQTTAPTSTLPKEPVTNPIDYTESYTISVLKSDDNAENDDAYVGFMAALEANGFVEGDNLSVIVLSCEGDEDKASTAAQDAIKEDTDLVYAIGELAASSASKATSDIPVVFASVADPIESGLLTSCEKPDKNLTGVSDYTPVREQLQLIKTLFPDAKTVSGLYYTSDEESILVSTLAEEEAKALGLEYTAYTAATKKEYESALASALEKGDALYLFDDSLTDTYLTEILSSAEDSKIPVFSTTENLVEQGCLATCFPVHEAIGYSSAEIALIILKDLKPINEIAVEYAHICGECVNSSVADSFSLDLSALSSYSKIVGEEEPTT